MAKESIFVTVGTTQFDSLIHSLYEPETIKALEALGCKKLVLQIGTGEIPSKNFESSQIVLETFRRKPNITNFMEASDLVISHAGAGSCLEVLKLRKPLLVVINEKLMNNHQAELAVRLTELNCAFSCTTSELKSTLCTMNLSELKPYESSGGLQPFVKALDELMEVA